MLFCRDHRRHLVKIALQFFERGSDLIFIQRRNWTLLNHFTFPVLRVSGYAEHKRAHVFFVLTHEQILNLCAAPDGEQK